MKDGVMLVAVEVSEAISAVDTVEGIFATFEFETRDERKLDIPVFAAEADFLPLKFSILFLTCSPSATDILWSLRDSSVTNHVRPIILQSSFSARHN
jgi:hypothetical protein